MPAEQVLDFMIKDRIINTQQRARISSLATDEDKSRAILFLIPRHPKGYATLIEALGNDYCGLDWLAHQICKDAEEFEKEAGE